LIQQEAPIALRFFLSQLLEMMRYPAVNLGLLQLLNYQVNSKDEVLITSLIAKSNPMNIMPITELVTIKTFSISLRSTDLD